MVILEDIEFIENTANTLNFFCCLLESIILFINVHNILFFICFSLNSPYFITQINLLFHFNHCTFFIDSFYYSYF